MVSSAATASLARSARARSSAWPGSGGLDGADEIRERDAVRVVADRRLLGRVVDGRLDAFELVQLPLDAGRAGGAGHALERELDSGFR